MKPQAHALPPDVQHAAFQRDLAINEVVRVNKAHEALLAECKRQRELLDMHDEDIPKIIAERDRQREQIKALREALENIRIHNALLLVCNAVSAALKATE